MAKTKSYWFPHDTIAFSDMKIETLLSVYGAEGYGFYWIIIETLSMEEGYKLIMSKKSTWGVLAKRTCSNPDTIKEFVKDCIEDFELFDSDGETFWSNSLNKRLAKRDIKTEKAREWAKIRWSKDKKTDGTSPTKIDKKKVNKPEGFEEFWDGYDKRVGRNKSLSLWSSLSNKDKKSCMDYIPKYKLHRPDKQYRKNPDTFLRNKGWEDEIVSKTGANEVNFDNISGNEHKQMFE
jgi:hypothetical protein